MDGPVKHKNAKMTNLPAKIKDPAHAVRILEALVEQIEKQRNDNTLRGRLNRPLPTELGWAEGTKAVLKIKDDGYLDERDAKADVIEALAQAYAPRMKEAGMKVPE